MADRYDIAIVGGGIVGLATAFLGLAYHHERRHYERNRGLSESISPASR